MNKGIYLIKCEPTGQAYVGSSTRIKERWVDHQSQLRRGVHHCKALQEAWTKFGSENFSHEVVEFCEDLEARESHWIQQYRDKNLAFNTSDTTFNPMRNQESIDKMLQTRGDKQKGTKATSAKFTEETYLQIVYALATTTYSAEDLSDYFGLSPRSIRDIQHGHKHAWIREQFPTQFKIMQDWRKKLKVFRSNDEKPPEITLPIDTSFRDNLYSFRRDYKWRSALLEELANLDPEADKKQIEVVERKLEGKKDPWLSLIHSDGRELDLYHQDECDSVGLKIKYLLELKAGKILRYKGWRLR